MFPCGAFTIGFVSKGFVMRRRILCSNSSSRLTGELAAMVLKRKDIMETLLYCAVLGQRGLGS